MKTLGFQTFLLTPGADRRGINRLKVMAIVTVILSIYFFMFFFGQRTGLVRLVLLVFASHYVKGAKFYQVYVHIFHINLFNHSLDFCPYFMA